MKQMQEYGKEMHTQTTKSATVKIPL